MARPSNLQEHELLQRIQSGDKEAFALVYELYFDVLFAHGMGMLHDDEQVRDAIQEVFVQMWNRREDLDITVSLSAYLYASTRYGVLKVIRRSKNYDRYLNHLQAVSLATSVPADTRVREMELAQAIERNIAALPHKMREVFELSRLQGLSHREIAALLQISEHTVKRQISNALSILREKLSEWQFLLL
ncbi:RNA polymerase sigma factor [Parapedobacter pyrenivorans]|uniref:RNA polymerase sigma factor n=1 Tax=Parapedobacter pyrenivorans TaxID=1305674 RepID=UPI00333EBFA5